MSILATAHAGQGFAERLMVDTCRIERKSTDAPVFDAATGDYTTSSPTLIYDGKCKVSPTGAAQVVQAGQEPVSLWPFTVAVPVSATGILLLDTVIVTASEDADLLDKELVVRDVSMGSAIVERRLGAELNAG